MNFRNVFSPCLFRHAVCALLCAVWGCDREDGIRQYAVPHEAARQLGPSASVGTPSADAAWFFKLTGPADAVVEQLGKFTGILRSLRFDPDGCQFSISRKAGQSLAGPSPRYLTLTVPDTDPPMELTVSSLPQHSTDYEEFLRANVNRWRNQLGLESMDGENWLDEARTQGELIVVPAETRTLAVVNLTGRTKEHGPSRMLAAIVTPNPNASPPPESPTDTAPLTFSTPEGWQAKPGNSMRLASFEVCA